MTIILAKDNDGNDDTGNDLNSIGKDDLKASHDGDSCRGFQLDCPHQAVLNMRIVSVEFFFSPECAIRKMFTIFCLLH